MKKIFSLIAVFIFTTSLMSVSPNVEVVEEYGNPSDCARMARTVVMITASEFGHDPNVDYFGGYLNVSSIEGIITF